MKTMLLACSALAVLVPFSAFAHDTGSGHGGHGPKIEIVGPGGGEESRKNAVFKGMDWDQDGAVSTQELISGSKKRFQIKDLDGNGWLSLEEFQREDVEEDGDPDVSLDADDHKGLEGVRARRFERLDGDGNGVLSEDEIIADGRERHVWMDINRDGRVTLVEVDARRAEAEEKAQRILAEANGFPGHRGGE